MYVGRDRQVNKETGYQLDEQDHYLPFVNTCRPARRPVDWDNPPGMAGTKRSKHEANYSPPSDAQV